MVKRNESSKQAETYSVRSVPYEGHVGAGRLLPFVPKDGVLEIAVPDSIPEDEPLGAMTIDGHSLARVGIYNGDVVLVRKIVSRRQIKRNTVVVVYIASLGEIMAKKVTFEDDYLILHYCGMEPEPPMYVMAGEAEIRGIVISASKIQLEWPFVDQVVPPHSSARNTKAAKANKIGALMKTFEKPPFEEPF